MPITEPTAETPSRWSPTSTLLTAGIAVVIVAGSWWMLGQLASVLRPLLLAIFLGYVLMPYYGRLRKKVPAPVAIGLIVGLTTAFLTGLALAVYGSLLGLNDDLPVFKTIFSKRIQDTMTWLSELPFIGKHFSGTDLPEAEFSGAITRLSQDVVLIAGGGLLEAATAGLYLFFLLLESANFPKRVRAAYPEEQAEHIMNVFGRINSAIISYLKAKFISSMVLAIPVGLLLYGFGVRFALLWAVLTFLCNFIPYIGSVVAVALPLGLAFLQFDIGWRFGMLAVILLLCHVVCATVLEPTIIGRAVGLSPIVILAALSIWGLLWGLPGMFLAVPLTMVVKIVCENIEATRPIAKLLSG